MPQQRESSSDIWPTQPLHPCRAMGGWSGWCEENGAYMCRKCGEAITDEGTLQIIESLQQESESPFAKAPRPVLHTTEPKPSERGRFFAVDRLRMRFDTLQQDPVQMEAHTEWRRSNT